MRNQTWAPSASSSSPAWAVTHISGRPRRPSLRRGGVTVSFLSVMICHRVVVDGTLRTEARLTRTGPDGDVSMGLAGSWAAGAVLVAMGTNRPASTT